MYFVFLDLSESLREKPIQIYCNATIKTSSALQSIYIYIYVCGCLCVAFLSIFASCSFLSRPLSLSLSLPDSVSFFGLVLCLSLIGVYVGYIWRTCFYWIVFIEIPNPKSKPHQRKKIRTLNESACIDSLTWISLRIWTSTTIWSERLTVGSIETVLITAAKRTTPSKCVSAFQMVWKLCQKKYWYM